MADQIYVGNFSKGQQTNRLAFNIGNDAFPYLFNAYTWRGRVKRKRGTGYLGQLQVQVQSVAANPLNWQFGPIPLTGINGNLLTFLGFSANGQENIVPGSITLSGGGQTFTEPTIPNGTLAGSGGGTGTINYATGAITISTASGSLTGTFSYYPGLPVMGLEDFTSTQTSSQNPDLLAFDTEHSYQCNQSGSNATFWNTTFYKTTGTPFTWNGGDFQQFWTTNYPSTTSNFAGALWATNNNPGLHMAIGTYVSGSPGTAITFTFTVDALPYTQLIVGDILWFNEWMAVGATINFITGTVTAIVNAAAGTYVITFATAQTVSGTGIAQTLTNTTLTIDGLPQDGIRWYDGDPTGGTGLPTGPIKGWVNFAPPLTQAPSGVEIDGTPGAIYYLVGALAILPFKDRLIFFSPYIQSSGQNGSSGIVFQLQDTALWCWNGTPFYTVNSLMDASEVPLNQTASPLAFVVDQTGLGGYQPAGIDNPIITISNNEDVLIVGFGGDGRKTRFVYTGNDLQPFIWNNINSEMPSSATFSAIPMDKGSLDIGQYGLTMTDQQSCQRVDIDIPDTIFQIQGLNNGPLRVNAIRDFFREWIYFAYPLDDSPWNFPTQTLLFNYRDNTWAIFYENFTHHGRYRAKTKRTWATIGQYFATWSVWNESWSAGSSQAEFTQIIAGNPQGYVLIKNDSTNEAPSGTISNITSAIGGLTQITSFNHCVEGPDPSSPGIFDYLYFTGAIGITGLNGNIARVASTIDANNFVIDIPFANIVGTYGGLGKFTRLSQPFIQTKQFPVYWEQGRGVRLGVQKYLFDKTDESQVTVNIYLSQDNLDAWNNLMNNPPPNSMIYSQIVFTCPESTNIGLTSFNNNLQMPLATSQSQIWHRFNTSLQGDSFQLAITLSDAQMKNLEYATAEIVLHAFQLTVFPGPSLS